MQGLIIGLLLTWLSQPYFFFSFLHPTPFSFGCYAVWFKTVLLGLHLREKRLQESSLAQQTLCPWMNYTVKSLFLRATKKNQALWRWAALQCNTSFLFVKKGFCTKKHFPLFVLMKRGASWRLHAFDDSISKWTLVSFQTGLLYLKVTQNHSEMERLAR